MYHLVFENIQLASFLETIIRAHKGNSLLVICSSREEFVQRCLTSLHDPSTVDDHAGSHNLAHLLSPILHRLAVTRSIKVIFCPTLTHLLAQLSLLTSSSDHDADGTAQTRSGSALLAVLDPIKPHRPTSAFSVQGLNKTFAAVVAAAHVMNARLLIAECLEFKSVDMTVEFAREGSEQGLTDQNPWHEHVSMLNVTTKTFGIGGTGWAGRTVPIRKVVERWCHVVRIETNDPVALIP